MFGTMCCLIAVLLIISHWLIWYVRRKVIYAAKLAGAHDFISELREGYNTIVGEQGQDYPEVNVNASQLQGRW